MKTFLIILIVAASFSLSVAEEGKFTKKQEQSLSKFSNLYRKLYAEKVLHGQDSVRAVKRMKLHLSEFNK